MLHPRRPVAYGPREREDVFVQALTVDLDDSVEERLFTELQATGFACLPDAVGAVLGLDAFAVFEAVRVEHRMR